MREILIDMEDMSDSKEVYSQEPNPYFALFIYLLLIMFVAALVYSFIGKIEIVSTGSGVIRPNENVSTVNTLLGGKIDSIYYSDGDYVNKGDILLVLEHKKIQENLDMLINSRDTLQRNLTLNYKYLDSLHQNINLFSSDLSIDEYEYYIEYEYYHISLKDKEMTLNHEENIDQITLAQLQGETNQIVNNSIGLNLLKHSIDQNENFVSAHDKYNSQYLLYCSEIATLKEDYQTQYQKIQISSDEDLNLLMKTFYTEKLEGYQIVLDSIQNNTNKFTTDNLYSKIYEEYKNTMKKYESTLQDSIDKHDLLLNGDQYEGHDRKLLKYHEDMYSGYKTYYSSVIENRNFFDSSKSGYSYLYLFQEFNITYNEKLSIFNNLRQEFEELVESSNQGQPVTEEDLDVAAIAMNEAFSLCENLKNSKISEINRTLLQIDATISELKINIGSTSINYDINAINQEISRNQSTIATYKASMEKDILDQIKQTRLKLEESILSANSKSSKEDLLNNLTTSYELSSSKKALSIIQQVENEIDILKQTEAKNINNLQKLQVNFSFSEDYKVDDGEKIPVAYIRLNETKKCLKIINDLKTSLDDLDYNISVARLEKEALIIKAEKTGTVNSISDFSAGDSLMAGGMLATIIPPHESEYKVQVYIDNKDIEGIQIGDKIKYNIAALSNNSAEVFEGKITKISVDTKIQDGSPTGYYLIEASLIDDTTPINNKESVSRINIGMVCTAKVVIHEKKIISYILEKINLQ